MSTSNPIRRLSDIPNIQSLEIPEREYIVPGVIARSTITLWTGDCGAGKSYLLLRMAVAVALAANSLDDDASERLCSISISKTRLLPLENALTQ